jgi:hypothetical protein
MFVFAIALGIAGSTYAQYKATNAQYRERWMLLGSTRVNGHIDHDTIAVTGAAGKFRAIEFRVHGGPVRFERIVVRFGNGSHEEIPIGRVVPSGGRSGAIDLPGDRRIIQSVDMWYGKAEWRTRPRVSVYGIR